MRGYTNERQRNSRELIRERSEQRRRLSTVKADAHEVEKKAKAFSENFRKNYRGKGYNKRDHITNAVDCVHYSNFEYTREDAIARAWEKNKGRVLRNLKPGEEMPENPPTKFLRWLTRKGASAGAAIDWELVEADLAGLTYRKIEDSVTLLAVRHVVIESHIERNLRDNKRDEAHRLLLELVEPKKETLAQEFAADLGEFFEELGADGEYDKIFDSVHKCYEDKRAVFKEIVEKLPNYANIYGTDDEWLKNDIRYMSGELLRKADERSKGRVKPKNLTGLYDLEDLRLGLVVEENIQNYGLGVAGGASIDDCEERCGMKLAKLHLCCKVFVEKTTACDALKETVELCTENFIADTIDDIDMLLEQKSESPTLSADVVGYSLLDLDAVYDVLDFVMDVYEEKRDSTKALKEGALFAHTKFIEKQERNAEVYRYKNDDFAELFTAQRAKDKALKTYGQEVTDLTCMINTINRFINQLGLGQEHTVKKSQFSARG